MNKTQLVDAVAQRAEIPKVTAKKSVEAFISAIKDALAQGDKVSLAGFGTFVLTKQPPRTGRNFKTGAVIEIAAKSVVKFRSSIESE
jgi:nucleoid DNA-binding protein